MLLCFIKWSNPSLVLILHVPSFSFVAKTFNIWSCKA
jgi:hypothetical protein